ncbi:MAG: flagellar assembly protein T N-terminal domain-containing protein [Syntrophales bacterium LBB04]|nr:flagellar assembly protein T N-terminal domain-containing protein [Syntrophales bacterium LBB04]
MRKVLAVIIASIMVCTISASFATAAGDKQKISAVGSATIHNNIIDIARDKAIDNALRTAVERVAGVMVTGSTEVENFQVKMDQILSESKGFVEQYRIISEKQNNDNYEVTIEAVIGTGKLEDRLKAIDLIVSRKSKPRLMIIFSEQAQKDAIAESAMSKYFLSKSFKLVDSSVIRRVKSELNFSSGAGNERALSSLAHTVGAEIVIYCAIEAASNSFVLSGIEMNTNKVTISVKVINGDTGDIITTDSESRSAPGAKGDVKGITEDAAPELAAKP